MAQREMAFLMSCLNLPYLGIFQMRRVKSLIGILIKLQDLLPAAFSMAVLGAIESLLCAVILDNMTDTKHRSNNELLAQGLGNIVSPFLGGITATAAIARSAANVKSGAVSPISSVVHALLVLFSLLFFANALSYLPLSSMAALLLMVAWHMANVPEIIRLARRSTQMKLPCCSLA